MRAMLIQSYGRGADTTVPITEWSREDLRAIQRVTNVRERDHLHARAVSVRAHRRSSAV